MKSCRLIGTLAGLGLLLGGGAMRSSSPYGVIVLTDVAAGIAAPGNGMEMPHSSPANQEFQNIEQPLGLKLGVTAAGLGLIGLELWWFLGSKPKSRKARSQQGIQELDVVVDGGYEPNQIVVQAGQPVRLNFFRKDPSSCLEQILIPDFRIAKDLPLNKRTAIDFTPQQPGNYPFTCGMNMYRGVIQVINANSQSNSSEEGAATEEGVATEEGAATGEGAATAQPSTR